MTTAHETVDRIHKAAGALRAESEACDAAGQLTTETAELMRASGGVRLLQAASHGGYEADPAHFFEWVRAVGRLNPSAGWVAGVVGVHPWEVALLEPELQDEIYGDDPDTWVASPYAPQGRAVPRDDGFVFSGRWSYSTGTDHCDWVVLGGIVAGEGGGGAPDVRHFFLPRGDYRIIEDSWQVMGLSGTGSKDIVIEEQFVPAYRTIGHRQLCDGAFGTRRAGVPLYQLPFGCVFSAAVASAAFGIAQGLVDVYRDYLTTRVSAVGVVGTSDPFQAEALAELEADISAGIVHVDAMIAGWMERASRGDAFTAADRLQFRRNQVRAVQRVLASADKLMSRAGSAAVWTTRPLERYWRDLRTAGTHVCNVMDSIYLGWAANEFETGEVVRGFY